MWASTKSTAGWGEHWGCGATAGVRWGEQWPVSVGRALPGECGVSTAGWGVWGEHGGCGGEHAGWVWGEH